MDFDTFLCHTSIREGLAAVKVIDNVAANDKRIRVIHCLIKGMRWGEIYQDLEDATDRAEDVADTLERIVVKRRMLNPALLLLILIVVIALPSTPSTASMIRQMPSRPQLRHGC